MFNMKYTRFTITNYKGIPQIALDLSKKPHSNIFTLVGLNESGKTSILEAINLFHHGIDKEKAHTLIPKSRQYQFNESISVEAELEFEDEEIKTISAYLQKHHKFIVTEFDKILTIKKSYHFVRSVPAPEKQWQKKTWTIDLYGKTKQAKSIKTLHSWKKTVWDDIVSLIKEKYLPKILYYQDFLFQFPEKIYLEEFEDEGKEQKEYRGVLQDILHSIDPGLSVEKDLLERMQNKDQKSHKEAIGQLLLKMSAKLNRDILNNWDAIFEGTQKKQVDVSWDSEIDKTNVQRYFIELKIQQGSASYSINDRSLGFRWFFSFLIFTAFRRSRVSDPGETLFLLDEPASNLHQRSQQKLLQSLEGIVSNCKLIYSTHSHHLIDPKWLAGTYIVRNKAINYDNPEEADVIETDIDAILYKNFVADHPNEEDHFKPILDALEYTPSKLELVTPVVFTEGKNDYYAFKYIAEVILEGKYNLNFYPGAGVDKYDSPFRLYIAWNKNFIALFDADGGGHNAKNRYIKDIGAEISDKIYTLEDIENKWSGKETEDLFSSEAEKHRIIQTCFEEHSRSDGVTKSKLNTAILELYLHGRKIELNKSTLKNFEAIFQFLHSKILT